VRNVKHLLIAIAVMVLIPTTFASAAYNVMVSVKGTKQGQFKGESAHAGGANKDKIDAIGFTFEIGSPRDAATGQVSGKRQYKPLQITKMLGAASPQFFQALTTNEVLQSVTLEFTKTNANGEEFIFYTIKLTNATIASIRQHTADTDAGEGAASAKHTGAASAQQIEDITISFQKIEITNNESKTMAVDDWQAVK
jgi:type VI secretion system secreted protein Hcp